MPAALSVTASKVVPVLVTLPLTVSAVPLALSRMVTAVPETAPAMSSARLSRSTNAAPVTAKSPNVLIALPA